MVVVIVVLLAVVGISCLAMSWAVPSIHAASQSRPLSENPCEVPAADEVAAIASLSEGELLLDFDGKGRVPLVPLSEYTLSPRLGGTYQFVLDGQGIVTHLLAHGAGSFVKAVRKDTGTVAK